jgi:hypothetical protein
MFLELLHYQTIELFHDVEVLSSLNVLETLRGIMINATSLQEGGTPFLIKYLQSATLINYVFKSDDAMSGILYTKKKVVVGNNNSYPDLQLGCTNGSYTGISNPGVFIISISR